MASSPDLNTYRSVTDPVPEEVAERELLARSRDGDTIAYSILVRNYQDAIYALVCRLIKDDHTAEELTQDTFLKAYRSLPGFRGDARFYTWLYRIAVNVCHDHRESLASRNRRRESSLDAPEMSGLEPPTRFGRPDHLAEESEVAADFRNALGRLDAPYRDAFVLRHQEGLSYDELAHVLRISKSNAKVRVHRAREMVLAVLRERGHEL